MPKYYETPKFRKLNAKWQEKLKKDGFVDHEEQTKPEQFEPMLKTWAFSLFRARHNATQYEARVTYYRLAGQFLHEHSFENKTQRTIWEHHCNGLSNRKTDEAMGNVIGVARRVVVKLRALMIESNKASNEE